MDENTTVVATDRVEEGAAQKLPSALHINDLQAMAPAEVEGLCRDFDLRIWNPIQTADSKLKENGEWNRTFEQELPLLSVPLRGLRLFT